MHEGHATEEPLLGSRCWYMDSGADLVRVQLGMRAYLHRTSHCHRLLVSDRRTLKDPKICKRWTIMKKEKPMVTIHMHLAKK